MSCKECEKKDKLTATVDNYQFCDETCANIAYFTKNEDMNDVRRENLIKFFTKAKKASEEHQTN